MTWRARFIGGPEDGVERPAEIGSDGKPTRVHMMITYTRCRSCEARAFSEKAIAFGPDVLRHVYVAVAYYEDRQRSIVVYAFNEPGCTITRG